MKKFIPIILLILFAFQCSKEEPKTRDDVVREHAWAALTEHEQSTVLSDWKEVPVLVTNYDYNKAYKIAYHTTDRDLLGPLVIYLDYDNLEYLGKDARD